ncbi:hypothetical protein V1515DRAFT_581832 [Lipomyces mesembrius]
MLLKKTRPEQRLDVQLSYEAFLELDGAFSEMKSEIPSLAYNGLTEIVTVVTAPTSIHEGAARRTEAEIIFSRKIIHLCTVRNQWAVLVSLGLQQCTSLREATGGAEKSQMVESYVETSETYDSSVMIRTMGQPVYDTDESTVALHIWSASVQGSHDLIKMGLRLKISRKLLISDLYPPDDIPDII